MDSSTRGQFFLSDTLMKVRAESVVRKEVSRSRFRRLRIVEIDEIDRAVKEIVVEKPEISNPEIFALA